MRILTVVGNRPQFIKAAAVSGLLRAEHEEFLVHTGQHYDDALSAVFFRELGLERPDAQLGIGGGSNTSQTSRMLAALEPLIAHERPDALLVYGDTNSTLAGALAAAQARVPVAHVEAGMRSFDRSMPEELNRVLTDHMSNLLLCASEVSASNLRAESAGGAIEVVGDVMVDVALRMRPAAVPAGAGTAGAGTTGAGTAGAGAAGAGTTGANAGGAGAGDGWAGAAHGLKHGSYLLLTAHRAGNVDDPHRLSLLIELIEALPGEVVFPVHPRTRARLHAAGLWERLDNSPRVRLLDPLGYIEFSSLLHSARAVVTDSGGVQKEAYLAQVPCVTLRPNTEWVETVKTGWNTLVDLDTQRALAALDAAPPREHPQLYGDGKAAERCVQAIGRLAA